MENLSDQKIIDSWKKNVKPWVSAVREGEILSRTLVTNQVIIDAVLETKPTSVLDVGCGEGWLPRELAKSGIYTLGIDIVPELIAAAEKEDGGSFRVLSLAEVSYKTLNEKFDMIVCNFSLLGNESVTHLFTQAASLLNSGGCFIIQTIHPVAGCGDKKYEDGWREGTWEGFSHQFSDPPPWYFRTLETWRSLFVTNGFRISTILEPLNSDTKLHASVVFIGVVSS